VIVTAAVNIVVRNVVSPTKHEAVRAPANIPSVIAPNSGNTHHGNDVELT
jgi:hypothetical protein